MIILFLLLFFHVIKVDHIQQKADFLLKNMSFFFIPAGIGILSSYDLISSSILPLLAVVVLTTILTFGATALTVQGVIALQDRLALGKSGITPGGLGIQGTPDRPTVPGNTDNTEGGELHE